MTQILPLFSKNFFCIINVPLPPRNSFSGSGCMHSKFVGFEGSPQKSPDLCLLLASYSSISRSNESVYPFAVQRYVLLERGKEHIPKEGALESDCCLTWRRAARRRGYTVLRGVFLAPLQSHIPLYSKRINAFIGSRNW